MTKCQIWHDRIQRQLANKNAIIESSASQSTFFNLQKNVLGKPKTINLKKKSLVRTRLAEGPEL